jgi:hypothetical protein
MNMPFDPDRLADESRLAADSDAPIDEWTLDELEQSGDLGSLRSAWNAADGAYD